MTDAAGDADRRRLVGARALAVARADQLAGMLGGAADRDRVLRFLDCAVLRHLHEIVEGAAKTDPTIEPFDTVRGMFVEGGEAFPGSGFHVKSHVQIAVRNPACIKGIFYPLPPI